MKTIDCNLQKENAQKFNRKIAELIQSKTGSQFLFSNISYEDEKTIGLFQRADTDHIFGFESNEIKFALKSYKPENFDDLVLLYALYKPANYPNFQRIVLQAKENQTFALFKDVLKKSDDVPMWREQVFAIMQKATGCSLACADLLRQKKCQGSCERQKTICRSGNQKRLQRAECGRTF